jgi:hypothetical protein
MPFPKTRKQPLPQQRPAADNLRSAAHLRDSIEVVPVDRLTIVVAVPENSTFLK